MPDISTITEAGLLTVVRPEIILTLFVLAIMTVDMFSEELPGGREAIPWIGLGGVIVTALMSMFAWVGADGSALSYQGAAIADNFAVALSLVVLTGTGLSILLSKEYMPRVNNQTGEYYALLLLCAIGMMLMGKVSDLITVFLALEIFSLALYILCGLNRHSPRSTESAMKYFLLGAFASAFFVYGAALIYGATGSTQYIVIAEMLASGNAEMVLLVPGIALMVVGFGFKVSLVPFHMWTADVYQGAPTPVTAFMSVGTKAAAFAAFIRLVVMALPTQIELLSWALAGLAVLTMVLGNLAALRQLSMKRMLAYSSIAHAGYVLVGLVAGTAESAGNAMFYLFVYAFMNIGAFAVVIMVENQGEQDASQNRFAGLAKRQPLMAAAMAIFMFSLAGIPPLAGFWGKFMLFRGAVQAGWIVLPIIGLLASALSLVYYLRVVIAMYMEESLPVVDPSETERSLWPSLNISVGVAAVAVVLIGLFPNLWAGWFLPAESDATANVQAQVRSADVAADDQ